MTGRAMPLADGLYAVPPGKLVEVVTSLDMPRRAAVVTPEARSDVRLRQEPDPATAWYRALFRAVGEPWLWSSQLRLDDAALGARLRDPAVAILAVERADADIGLLDLDFRREGEAEIVFFGLVPEATGQGLGDWLMAQALALAWARPITRVWLHTCTSDSPAALPFYLRHGFVPFRRHVEVGDDPRARGLLPRSAAPRIPLL